MFYHYVQNNSGGHFDFDEQSGITHHVIIEAPTPTEADDKLELIGGYFNGCESGRDCNCCGDRWYGVDKWSSRDFPHIYGASAYEPLKYPWRKDNKEVVIHYANGRVEWPHNISKPIGDYL